MSTRLIMPVPSKETATPHHFATLPPPPRAHLRKACRVLFGKPTKDDMLFVANELREIRRAATEKYNFDFEKGVPIVSPNANYHYTTCEIVRAPVKKKRNSDPEEETEHAYFKPDEMVLKRLRDDCNSNKVLEGTVKEEEEEKKVKDKKQTCITDFMSQRKRNLSVVIGEKSEVGLVPQKTMKLEKKTKS